MISPLLAAVSSAARVHLSLSSQAVPATAGGWGETDAHLCCIRRQARAKPSLFAGAGHDATIYAGGGAGGNGSAGLATTTDGPWFTYNA